MISNPDRVEQFTAEIADMHLPDTASGRDKTLVRVGIALMVVGVILGIVGYLTSSGSTNPLDQRDGIVMAIVGLIVAVVGAAVFVRYSMAQFLRFWLARLSWEQTAATDRMVEAVRSRD